MNSYLDRFFVMILAIVMNRLLFHWDKIVVYTLIALIIYAVSSLLQVFSKGKLEGLVYIVLSMLSFIDSYTMPFVGILIYSILYKHWKNVAYMIATGIVTVVLVYRYTVVMGIWSGCILACFYLVIMFLAAKDHDLELYRVELMKVRDNATELTNTLRDRNRYLVDNQEKEVRIAMLSERNRIAREIHDNVGHILSRSILQLGAIMAVHKGDVVYEQLTDLKDTLNLAMTNIRESVHDLHKESFDVKQASEAILEELDDREVVLRCDISDQADKEVKYAFVTILKEAVTNIQKHSNATKVKVIISELEEYYQMLIEDNGTSSEGLFHAKSGIGIENMEERIRCLGGICNVTMEVGFRIFISVPKVIKSEE